MLDKDTFSREVIVPALSSPFRTVQRFPNFVEIRAPLAENVGVDMFGHATNVVVIRGVVRTVGNVRGVVISNAFPGS